MIILFGSQKGGCGKSTLCVNTSAALATMGKDVVLVDCDRQGTASNWIQERNETSGDRPTVHAVQKYDDVRETLKDLSKRYEYVVVDSAGRDSKELRTAMLVADTLIIPTRPSQADLDTLEHVSQVVDLARDYNDSLNVKVVLTMNPTNPTINEVTLTREYLNEYPEFYLMDSCISDRKVYRDAMSDGKGVIEMDNPKANEEVSQFVREIIE